jgi:hypothetical protein
VFHICFGIASLWLVLLLFYKLFANSSQIWKMRWFVDFSLEAINMVVFTSCVILLKPTFEKNEYIRHDEESVVDPKDIEMSS